MTPLLLAKGIFHPIDLLVTVSESNRHIDSLVEDQIEELWKTKVKLAEEQGKTIYNGLSYRLNSLVIDGAKLRLDFGIFDFKTRECLVEAQGYENLTEEYFRKGCHSQGTIRTADGKYLLVELSGKSLNFNKVDFIGGIMETKPELKTGEDVFQSFLLELEEEACIGTGDIEDIYLNIIYLNIHTNVGFYFEVLLNIGSEELAARFARDGKDQDIKSLKILSKEDYLTTLRAINANKAFIANHVGI
jgi:hypothetical protein